MMPGDDLDECRRRRPLPLLMQQLGFAVQTGQNSYCPFHPDQKSKHKSFSVSQRGERYFWRCWGQCGESGDEVRFLEKLRGISNREAIALYKQLAGVTPRPKSQPEAPFNWSKCVEAFTPAAMERLATSRGLKKETVSWANEAGFVGIFKNHYAFAVFDRARRNVVATHYRLDNGDWLYYPAGVTDKTLLLTIGDVTGEGPFYAFESQWDGLSFVEVSGERSGIIITRGKSNGRLVPEALQPDAIVYVWTQNDPGGGEWEQDVCKSGRLTVKRVKIPAEFKDLNDWVKAGATADDLFQAIQNAETITTAATQVDGQTQVSSSSQAPAVDLTGNGAAAVDFAVERLPIELEPEPERPRPLLSPDRLPKILANAAQAISLLCKAPFELCAPMVTAVISMAIGKGLCVISGPKRITRGNLFFIGSKISGSGGSQVFAKAFEPFAALQQIVRKNYEEQTEPNRIAELIDIEQKIKIASKALEKEKNPAAHKEIKDELVTFCRKKEQLLKIKSPTIYVTDITPESLDLENFQNEDALLVPHFRSKPKSLKEAQAGEHGQDDALKFYTERKWPTCDVVVSNPPFLGIAFMRRELGDEYVDALFASFDGRVARGSDLCCYWFEKARDLIEHGDCKRAGLLATQGIRGGASREILKNIKNDGDIFFAVSDRNWILDGANVHVSMIGFDDGLETSRMLDGKTVAEINPNLTAASDITSAKQLTNNAGICFMGPSAKAPFDVSESTALELIRAPNPHGVVNSDVLRRVHSAIDLTKKDRHEWTIDFGSMPYERAIQYEGPFAYVQQNVFPIRSMNRRQTNEACWQYERPRVDMRKALSGLTRFVCTPGVAKHRIYVWRTSETLCNQGTLVFACEDDYSFGILHSRFHEVWARAQGTQLRERESGFRYTPTTCFETFPFPEPKEQQKIDISTAAKKLSQLRENWLNPPEWTTTSILEFPGSIDGPWSHFVVDADARGIGTVRYPRVEPRDDDCTKKLAKRTLTNLYNERPAWLEHAHAKLDAAVAAAYGSNVDLTNEQILEKLLALNIERANDEKKSAAKQRNSEKISRVKSEHEMI
jgi:hypothetical protein